jgi:MinD superfamily P-loop ATPase
MRLAVLSGKGGTGKTTVAASLALVIPDSQYLDCDVEEPNGFLFLKPVIAITDEVTVLVPDVDPDLCTRCGACARICQFNAIAVTPKRVLVFPEVCHHCGACALACKPYAISEIERPIGSIESDAANRFVQGRLNVGEPVGLPIITAMKQRICPDRTAILDCAPGASCAVVRSIDGCDYALLVTEPTPFGLHDLKIAVALVRQMGLRSGVVLNKSDANDPLIEDYCSREDVPVLIKIPYSREIAEHNARGILPVQINKAWQDVFVRLYQRLGKEVSS